MNQPKSNPYRFQQWFKLPGRTLRQTGSTWLNAVLAVLMLGSMLLSPLDATPVQAASTVILTAPANGATITIAEAEPVAVPEFSWQPVAGTIRYRLQVGADIAFSTIILNITTPNTTYTPTDVAPFADGVWYWRVKVDDPAGSDYGEVRTFTKQWATPGNLPTLQNPANGATIDFFNSPVFSWTPVMGAARYQVQIYSSPSGWGSLLGISSYTISTTYQPISKLANGTYYWRVVPLDSGNHRGTPSEERSFVAGYNPLPQLLEPADFAEPTFTPTFKWTAVQGAQYYELQYSTDQTFNTNTSTIATRRVWYTPTSTLSNDVNYYWRVRTHSGSSITSWTDSYTFIKRWYIKPVLLTPTNNYQYVLHPVYSWTPVPGAAYYKIEISKYIGFNPIYVSENTANTFYTPIKYDGSSATYYWKVTPYDGNDKPGTPSNTSSFVSWYQNYAPQLVYPLYYYMPDTYAGFPGVITNPHEDRTVAYPYFIWNRMLVYSGAVNQGAVYADSYRVQVSTSPIFSSISWEVDTENLFAAPTTANPFVPTNNTNYYWRVRALIGGVESGQWSQVWRTRFNNALAPDATATPSLISPTDGFEFAEMTPSFRWFPISGAASYDVQTCWDALCAQVIETANVPYPNFAPTHSLAQRSLGDVNFGVYYWRVRKGGTAPWSEIRRFQIAAQSQWQLLRTKGSAANRLQIGSDVKGENADPTFASFDLSDLNASQDKDGWYFGFSVPSGDLTNVDYELILDYDHLDDSGGTSDPCGHGVTTIAAFRPEHVLCIARNGTNIPSATVNLYSWTGAGWSEPAILSDLGGILTFDGTYVEAYIPNTAITSQETTGTYTASLMSFAFAGTIIKDIVPTDAAALSSKVVSRFSNVTERVNLLTPLNDAGVDPTTYSSFQPMVWTWPILAPWSGMNMKISLDPGFTTQVAWFTLTTSDAPYYAPTTHESLNDINGDNTYYWRVQQKYKVGTTDYFGNWSQGYRFERVGFAVDNLQLTGEFATPTFSWDMVEGAAYYDLEVDNDPAFGSKEITVQTRMPTYTWTSQLVPGTYYWRVRAHRYGGAVINDYSPAESFTVALPVPTGLTRTPAGVVNRAPTFCWTPLVLNDASAHPYLAAWKYVIQVSKDSSFSAIFEEATTEQNCYTPVKGYDDGTYYWRLAMIDGDSHKGPFTGTQTFTKQYPVTSLVSPGSGSTSLTTPTFVWTPVNGAARYRIQTSTVSNFSSTLDSVDTASTSFTPTRVYANASYYWRVAILDYDGKLGPWTGSTILIYTSKPGAFNKTAPGNGSTGKPTNVMLTWGTAQYAESYQYCISKTNPCSNWTNVGLSTSATMSALEASTKYYWNVRAHNLLGDTYANASTTNWSFTTATSLVPTLTTLTPNKIQAGSGGFTLTVTGTGFLNGYKVLWDGAELATTFVSATQLNAQVPAANITALQLVPVSVLTTDARESAALTFTVHTFADVLPGVSYFTYVESLYAEGITGGCATNPLRYCPLNQVTRAQMAVFILKAKYGSTYLPETPTGTFSDVPVSYWAAAWVEQLAEEGITSGCGAGLYCPQNPVTRAQMAVFLLKAKYGSSYVPPAATGEFSDVAVNYWAAAWIEQLAAEGITSGCSAGMYCPLNPVTRAQMAVFIDKAFGFPLVP